MLWFCSFFMKQEDNRKCPFCGQALIPFKLGVCICGQQVGSIQYVKDPHMFAKNHYFYLGNTICEKYDTAVDETFAGIEEFVFIR